MQERPIFYIDNVSVRREGDSFHVHTFSEGVQVAHDVHPKCVATQLADQLVRALTAPPKSTIAKLPPRSGGA